MRPYSIVVNSTMTALYVYSFLEKYPTMYVRLFHTVRLLDSPELRDMADYKKGVQETLLKIGIFAPSPPSFRKPLRSLSLIGRLRVSPHKTLR